MISIEDLLRDDDTSFIINELIFAIQEKAFRASVDALRSSAPLMYGFHWLEQKLSLKMGRNYSHEIFKQMRLLGYESLTLSERIVLLVKELDWDVSNGGFHQYFFNYFADFANDVPPALDAIRAPHAASIVRQAIAIFPGGPPSRDWNKRGGDLKIKPGIRYPINGMSWTNNSLTRMTTWNIYSTNSSW